MMSAEMYLAFVAASAALALLPGPNVAVIVANSLTYGTRYGLLTVAGTSSAQVPQLILTTLGMTAMLSFIAGGFETIRWLGVAYLLYIGVQAFRAPPPRVEQAERPTSLQASGIYWRGVIVSLTNPKTLLFFGAFFPQFIDPAQPHMPQLALLSATFLFVGTVIDAGWALAAGHGRALIARGGRWFNWLTGGLYLGAGLALALARRP
jgi:homoserine/homoserine lactone efflux protein